MMPTSPESRIKKIGCIFVFSKSRKIRRNKSNSFNVVPVNTVCLKIVIPATKIKANTEGFIALKSFCTY